MNNTFRIDFAANDGLQGLPGTVRHDFCVDLASSLEKTKDRGFIISATSAFTSDSFGPEVGFINFYFSLKRRGLLTVLSNLFSDQEQITVNRITVKTG